MFRKYNLLLLILLLPLYQNCGGFVMNEKFHEGFSSAQEKFQCDPTALPTVSNTRRLTKREYINTLKDLGKVLSSSDQQGLMSALSNKLDLIPDDTNIDSRFSENSNFVSQQLTDAIVEVSLAYSDYIVANNTRLRQFIGECAVGGEVNATCVNQFASTMGKKIFRRPLSTEEVQDLNNDLSSYTDSTAKWLIARMLASPKFFMHIEDTKKDLGGGLHEITDHALASRISYFLLDTMPDDELLAAADSGKLATQAGVEAELKRLDQQAHRGEMSGLMKSFFDQWLKIDELTLPDHQANTLMQNYAAGDSLTRQSVRNEIHEMVEYYTFTNPGKYSDLFTSDISFAIDEDLAKVYGVPVWDGSANNLVRFPEGQRAGLVTRAAFLANQGSLSKPITRGIHIRHDLLCDPLPSPPAEIFELRAIPFDQHKTTRQRVANKTSHESCMVCHDKINDTGFALENYDSFGRFRLHEKIFDPESGTLLQEHPVDSFVQPRITPETVGQTFSSPVDYSHAIAESGAAERCFVTTFYEFVYSKAPDVQADGCQLEQMRVSVNEEGGSLKELLLRVPASKQFRLKRVSE